MAGWFSSAVSLVLGFLAVTVLFHPPYSAPALALLARLQAFPPLTYLSMCPVLTAVYSPLLMLLLGLFPPLILPLRFYMSLRMFSSAFTSLLVYQTSSSCQLLWYWISWNSQ
jgi:hypothetical protein